jgi:predicted transposase/invertase (TIGR01784 family)
VPQDTTSPPVQSHDSLFRLAFGQPAHAAAILQAILPPTLAERFDWTRLELRPGSFVDTDLSQHHVDVLYRVKVGHSDALVHVLLEHQREGEPLMAYRLLRYCVRIWEDWLRTAPRSQHLPPILPVVVHHSRRGWTAPTRLSGCWTLSGADLQALAPYLP